MSFGQSRGGSLSLAAALACALAGVAPATQADGGQERPEARQVDSYLKSSAEAAGGIYIVGFVGAPLALADADPSQPVSLPRNSEGRLQVNAPEALDYVRELANGQQAILGEAAQQLGRPLEPLLRFQHAFNGVVLRLSESEAAQLGTRADVVSVEPYHEYPLDTDVGPSLIGAPGIWNGSSTLGPSSRGEGVVIGVIDSGANLLSPSFSATDLDGYTHVNPLGSGNFLGFCNPSHPSHDPARDLCNDKLIGGWDFVHSLVNVPTATVYESVGFEDEGGHGSHTASTAGGNRRNAVINGLPATISGVAPRANLIIYDACYTNTGGQGLCPNVSTIASINQAVADGLVDVINYSIGGGSEPWLEGTSQAFLAAHNAGIYIAASAGNSGPGPSTLGHLEPWVTTTAASTHSRLFGATFTLTAPGTPPANTLNIQLLQGAGPWPTMATSGPLVVSPNFANGGTDGCTAYTAGTFTGAIAVLHLDAATSACASGTRRTAALNAGAIGVIFVDEAYLNLGAGSTSWAMLRSDFDNVAAAIAGDPASAAATIGATQAFTTGQADAMASFSSRGPNKFTLLKPDLTGPGVSILAAYDRWNTGIAVPGALIPSPTADNEVNVISGTSMSSPHHAGSAALLRALNRSWTPTQIKTALVTTTTTVELVKEDFVTPSDPFDRGSGRLDLSKAAKAGLIMDETGANFAAADPTTGGDPSQLNLPSFQNLLCVGTCSFPRSVRGTRAQPITWTATLSGLPMGSASVTPSSFSASSLSTSNFTLSIDSLQLPDNTTLFGELVLSPSNPSIPEARMAIAVRKAPPDISVTPLMVDVVATDSNPIQIPVNISNAGNPSLNWNEDSVGTAPTVLLNQPNNGANGFVAGYFLLQAGGAAGAYYAEDLAPTTDVVLRSIRADGFMAGAPTQTMQQRAQSITYRVYSNDPGNFPAGNPDAGAAGEVWSCTRTPTDPGMTFLTAVRTDGGVFELDLTNATGCPAAPTLSAGTKYWVSVTPAINGTSAQRRWVWFRSAVADTVGSPAQRIGPVLGLTSWAAIPAPSDLSMQVVGNAQCGAPWFSLTPSEDSLGIGGLSSGTLTIDPTGLTEGDYIGYLCIDTLGTDPDEAKVSVPVFLSVKAPILFSDGFESPPEG